MGLVQDLRAKEAGRRMGQDLRQGGRVWGGFRITETRKQGMTWLQALRDKEVGHGVGSESQRQ